MAPKMCVNVMATTQLKYHKRLNLRLRATTLEVSRAYLRVPYTRGVGFRGRGGGGGQVEGVGGDKWRWGIRGPWSDRRQQGGLRGRKPVYGLKRAGGRERGGEGRGYMGLCQLRGQGVDSE